MAIPAVLPSVTSPLSRKPTLSDMAANRCHSAGSFFYRACTVTLRFLTLSAAMGAVAGNLCGDDRGSVAAPERKVIVQCPLTADVNQTKQSVMIKLFSNSSHGADLERYHAPQDGKGTFQQLAGSGIPSGVCTAKGMGLFTSELKGFVFYLDMPKIFQRQQIWDYSKEVLGCDWLSHLGKFDCPPSLFQAELIAIRNDSVLASLPKHSLQKGDYRCQLVPYDRDQPFTDCTIAEQEETTTESQVTPTTAVHHETDEKKISYLLNGPQEKSFAGSADDRGGLVAAVVVLTITVFCLLMAMAAMVIFHLRYRGYRYPRYMESPQNVLEALLCTQSTPPWPVPSPDEKGGGLHHCSTGVHHVSCNKSI